MVLDEAPSIMKGRYLRSGIKYRDLSCHLLTVDERLFICWEVLGENENLPFETSPSPFSSISSATLIDVAEILY